MVDGEKCLVIGSGARDWPRVLDWGPSTAADGGEAVACSAGAGASCKGRWNLLRGPFPIYRRHKHEEKYSRPRATGTVFLNTHNYFWTEYGESRTGPEPCLSRLIVHPCSPHVPLSGASRLPSRPGQPLYSGVASCVLRAYSSPMPPRLPPTSTSSHRRVETNHGA